MIKIRSKSSSIVAIFSMVNLMVWAGTNVKSIFTLESLKEGGSMEQVV